MTIHKHATTFTVVRVDAVALRLMRNETPLSDNRDATLSVDVRDVYFMTSDSIYSQ
jgi:hypothetical protein